MQNYSKLLSQVFTNTKKYSLDYLCWQYKDNPFGEVIGFDAFFEGELVAHYVCIPTQYIFKDKVYIGLISLNTATHPQFNGKGLFTKLANSTYNLAIEKGYKFIMGVANSNSTHGFLNKLGFVLIGNLDVVLYFKKYQLDVMDSFFRLDQTDIFLQWRSKSPPNSYFYSNSQIFSNTDNFFIKACLSNRINIDNRSESNNNLFVKMSIGINNQKKGIFKLYVPNKLKPSPLNLIYKKLSLDMPNLIKSQIYFEIMDFDAY